MTWRMTTAMLVTILVGAYVIDSWVNERGKSTYALQPDDCKYAGMAWTGWEIHRTYKGGINNGGITAATEYECKK